MDGTSRSRWRRRLIWSAALLALYALLGFVVAPWWARPRLEQGLAAELSRPVAIEKLSFNPFSLVARAEGISLGDGHGKAQLTLKALTLNYQLSSVFTGVTYLRSVAVDTPQLKVRHAASGELDLPQPRPAPPPAGDAKDAAVRRFRIDTLSIDSGAVHWIDAGYGDAVLRLDRVVLAATEFGNEPQTPGHFELHLHERSGADITVVGQVDLDRGSLSASVDARALKADVVRPFLAASLPGYLDDAVARVHFKFRRDRATPSGRIEELGVEIAPLKLAAAAGGESLLSLDSLALQGGTVDFDQRRFEATLLSARGGTLPVRRNSDGSLNLDVLLPASAAEPAAPAPSPSAPWTWRVGTFKVEELALVLHDETVTPATAMDCKLASLQLAPLIDQSGERSALDFTLAIGTQGKLQGKGTVAVADGDGEIDVDLSGIELPPAQPYLAQVARIVLRSGSANAQGKVSWHAQGAPGTPRVSFRGNAGIDRFATVDAARQRDFLNWKSLSASAVEIDVEPDRVRVGDVEARGLFARLIIASDRSTNIGDVIVADEGEPSAPLDVAVRKVLLRDSRVRFADFSLTPRFVTTIESLDGTITGLSSKPGAAASVELKGQVDAYAPVTVVGKLNPFNGAENTDVNVVFRNVELSSLTPYSGKFAGYAIDRGKLNLDLQYKVEQRKLLGRNKVVLDQLVLGEKIDSPDAVGLPLKLAIALLQDRDGRIDVDIPVEGDLDDPQFRLGGVIWKAVFNLLTKIVTAPFALLGALGGGDEDPNLSRIAFDFAGVVPLESEAKKFALLRKALHDRPQLLLSIRGVADPVTDRRALAEAALKAQIAAEWAKRRAGDDTTEVPPPEVEREILVTLHEARVGATPAAPVAAADAGEPASADLDGAIADWLGGVREALRDSFAIEDKALLDIAEARAAAIKDALLSDATVAPEQVFLSQPGLDTTGTGPKGVELVLDLSAR